MLALSVCIVIVADSRRDLEYERQFIQHVHREREFFGIAEDLVPTLVYHVDSPAEAQYCRERLGITADQGMAVTVGYCNRFADGTSVVTKVLASIKTADLKQAAVDTCAYASRLLQQQPSTP